MNQYLGGIVKEQEVENKDDQKKILEKLVEATEKKEGQQNLKHISEKFILEKFTSKNSNATQWMEIFEKECIRFNVIINEAKIEILRLFLEKSCLDWYSSMATKLTTNSEWKEWKEIFLETFQNRGWNMVTYAFAFRYREGLLIDYAMKKERLILDINKSIDPKTLIDLIATVLPEFILNKINRDDLEDSTDLFNEIRKYEGIVYKKITAKSNNSNFGHKIRVKGEKPCKTCENLNKGSRYQPEEACWFKTKDTKK